ncbi:MAG: hypothetical protein WC676_08285 [Candidatus Omnitrophota bacterium]
MLKKIVLFRGIIISGAILFLGGLTAFSQDAPKMDKVDFVKKIKEVNAIYTRLQESQPNLYFEKNFNHSTVGTTYRKGKYLVKKMCSQSTSGQTACFPLIINIIDPDKSLRDIYPSKVFCSSTSSSVPGEKLAPFSTCLDGGQLFIFPGATDDFKLLRFHEDDLYDNRNVWITEFISEGSINKYVFDQETGLCLLEQEASKDGMILNVISRENITTNSSKDPVNLDGIIGEKLTEYQRQKIAQDKSVKRSQKESTNTFWFSLALIILFTTIYLLQMRTFYKSWLFILLFWVVGGVDILLGGFCALVVIFSLLANSSLSGIGGAILPIYVGIAFFLLAGIGLFAKNSFLRKISWWLHIASSLIVVFLTFIAWISLGQDADIFAILIWPFGWAIFTAILFLTPTITKYFFEDSSEKSPKA